MIAFAFGSTPIVEALGWTLLHFVWQGAVVALVLALVLDSLREANPRLRYLVSCGGMLAMLGLPLITLLVVSRGAAATPADATVGSALLGAAAGWLDASRALPWLVLAWSAGVALLLTRTLLQWLSAWRLVRHHATDAPPAWQASVTELCARMGIRRPVRLRSTTRALGPLVIGWLQPIVVVPAVAFSGLSAAQLRAVLIHELAHVRRCDYFVNLAQTLVESLLFYHPAVWWLSSRLRAEREYCCDDQAVQMSGDTPCYVRALLVLDELRDAPVRPAMAAQGGSLMTRMTRLIDTTSPTPRGRRSGKWIAAALCALSLSAAASALTAGAPLPQDQQRLPRADQAQDPVKRGTLRRKRDAKAGDRRALVRKLEAEGFSPEEIQRLVGRLKDKSSKKADKATGQRRRARDARAEVRLQHAELEEKLAAMRAAGKSDEEIHKVLGKLRRKMHNAEVAADQRAAESAKAKRAKIRAKAEKLRAAGLSDNEVKAALEDMLAKERDTEGRRRERAARGEHDRARETWIADMRAKGLSADQIREVLAKKEHTERAREERSFVDRRGNLRAGLKQRLERLRASGKSEAEIKEIVAQWERRLHESRKAAEEQRAVEHADRAAAEKANNRRLPRVKRDKRSDGKRKREF
ncbi:MAG: M56 family metallopeptidase [Planctomycetota bacterium]